MRPIALTAAMLVFALFAAPLADAGELELLLLIGDEEVPDEDAAGAFKRLIENKDNFKVLAGELRKMSADSLEAGESALLVRIARTARTKAIRWQSAGIHDQNAFRVLSALHDLTGALHKRKAKEDVNASLAHADALVALSLERINRADRVTFKESFEAAAQVCLDAVAVDKARAEDCAVQASQILRLSLPHTGQNKLLLLDRANAVLDEIGSNSARIQAERARVLLGRAHHLLRNKKKSDAKAAALKGLELVQAGKESKDVHAIGAYNDLAALAVENRWVSDKTKLVTESGAKGGFSFTFPSGAGWTYGNEGNLKGKGRFLLERRRPDGVWVEVGLASFSAELGYGTGDVPGGKPKAILQMTKQIWSSVMRKPKSGSANKKLVPGGFTCVGGYTLTGRSRGNAPMTVFAWACKSPEFSYVFTVLVEGANVKKLPSQARDILASVQAE